MHAAGVAKCMLSMVAIIELEITVGHWPFPTNFTIMAEQSLIARTNLLYISNGEAIDSL